MTPPIRVATPADARAIAPLMEQFNREEGIEWRPRTMLPALDRLLNEPSLGLVVVATSGVGTGAAANAPSGPGDSSSPGAIVGYGVATFGFDLEFGGRDAFVTELFVDSAHRRSGVGRALLAALVDRLEAHDAHAVHLFVRPENDAARRLYESLSFAVIPRLVMTRRRSLPTQ